MLPVAICSFFFISFKGISFKKAALIRNLPGQNEITPELRVAALLETQRLLLILSLYHHIYPSI